MIPMRAPHPYQSAGWTYYAALAALALITAAGALGGTTNITNGC